MGFDWRTKVTARGSMTKMTLARMYHCDGQTAHFAILRWIVDIRALLLAEGRAEFFLSYSDKIFRELELKASSMPNGVGICLTLTRVAIASTFAGRGLFTMLRGFLEHLSTTNKWRFVVQAANGRMTRILISKPYFRIDPASPIRCFVMHREYQDWEYDQSLERSEFSVLLSHLDHAKIAERLPHLTSEDSVTIESLIEALVSRLRGK